MRCNLEINIAIFQYLIAHHLTRRRKTSQAQIKLRLYLGKTELPCLLPLEDFSFISKYGGIMDVADR